MYNTFLSFESKKTNYFLPNKKKYLITIPSKLDTNNMNKIVKNDIKFEKNDIKFEKKYF